MCITLARYSRLSTTSGMNRNDPKLTELRDLTKTDQQCLDYCRQIDQLIELISVNCFPSRAVNLWSELLLRGACFSTTEPLA